MDSTLLLILGYMGPIILIGMVCIFIKLIMNRSEHSQVGLAS